MTSPEQQESDAHEVVDFAERFVPAFVGVTDGRVTLRVGHNRWFKVSPDVAAAIGASFLQKAAEAREQGEVSPS